MSSQARNFSHGEKIFTEGEAGSCAYLIEKGHIEIFIGHGDSEVVLTTLGPGEVFGEMSVIDGSPRSASARAHGQSELVVISAETISERIDSSDPIVGLLISTMLRRMRRSNQSVGGQVNVEEQSKLLLQSKSKISPEAEESVRDKMRMESELKQALVNGEFILHYQPIMDVQKGSVSGFEALIRWQSPQRGLVRPDIFMSIAEETSLIVPIGKWVIEESISALKELNKLHRSLHKDAEDLFMSINISGRQFHDQGFHSHLQKVIESAEVETSQIKLEVTERIFMEGPAVVQSIRKCRDMGFHVALDDFGTGYSSLSYLAQFQVDSLKVDQSFVRTMLEDDKTYVITNSIIMMANGLGIPVIAEGIESGKEHQTLRSMDCRFGQGYLFSRPVPLKDALDFLVSSTAQRIDLAM